MGFRLTFADGQEVHVYDRIYLSSGTYGPWWSAGRGESAAHEDLSSTWPEDDHMWSDLLARIEQCLQDGGKVTYLEEEDGVAEEDLPYRWRLFLRERDNDEKHGRPTLPPRSPRPMRALDPGVRE